MVKNEKEDLDSLDQIIKLVDLFYGKVKEDNLIGPIFEDRIKGHWDKHLQKMYTFWQTVLLAEHTYYGSPFPPHAKLPIDKKHFLLRDYYKSLFNNSQILLFLKRL